LTGLAVSAAAAVDAVGQNGDAVPIAAQERVQPLRLDRDAELALDHASEENSRRGLISGDPCGRIGALLSARFGFSAHQ
jgi:hypothetical protein